MKKKVLQLITLASFLMLLFPSATYAFNPYGGVSCNSAGSSAVCNNNGNPTNNPISGSDGLLYKITIIIAFVAGIAAVILIIISAIRFMSSGGDSNAVGQARGTILNAVIGLIIITLAASIISYVVNKS
jgi:hypothetical protein